MFTSSPVFKNLSPEKKVIYDQKLSPSSPSFFKFSPVKTTTICKEYNESKQKNLLYKNISTYELNNNDENNNVMDDNGIYDNDIDNDENSNDEDNNDIDNSTFHNKENSLIFLSSNDIDMRMDLNINNGMTEKRRINLTSKKILQDWILEHQKVLYYSIYYILILLI